MIYIWGKNTLSLVITDCPPESTDEFTVHLWNWHLCFAKSLLADDIQNIKTSDKVTRETFNTINTSMDRFIVHNDTYQHHRLI